MRAPPTAFAHGCARIAHELRIQRRLATIAPGVWQRDGYAFGSPCVAGTTVPTEALASRFRAGDTIAALAADYNVTAEQVAAALRFELNEAHREEERAIAEADATDVEDRETPCFVKSCKSEPRFLGQICAEHWEAMGQSLRDAIYGATGLQKFALLMLAKSRMTSDEEDAEACDVRAEELRQRAIWAGDGDPFKGLTARPPRPSAPASSRPRRCRLRA